MPSNRWHVFTDGGARGNPGPAAIGVVIQAEGGTIHTISQVIGSTTNNQAEYQAVYAALQYCVAQAHAVDIFCDSELVVKQIQGKYKLKNKELGVWFLKIRKLLDQLPGYTITAIPRERNHLADALVNKALDESL